MQIYYKMPLEELCSLLIKMTRGFAENFPSSDVCADAIERGMLCRAVKAMYANAGLTHRENTDIKLVASVLERERGRETLGACNVFDGRNDPELGAVGEVRELLELTERGEMIDARLSTLKDIAHIRSVCRARIDAKRLLMDR